MFEAEYFGRPKPAERPRVRFSEDSRSYYTYIPPQYEKYKTSLINFFNKYENEDSLEELFNPKKIVYGLSVKLIFKMTMKVKEKNPDPKKENLFYARRPDIDNLYKAVIDSLFQSDINQIPNGYVLDNEGEPLLDDDKNPIIKYKQRIDDSRVIHTEILKKRVKTEEEEGFSIVIRNVGKDEIK